MFQQLSVFIIFEIFLFYMAFNLIVAAPNKSNFWSVQQIECDYDREIFSNWSCLVKTNGKRKSIEADFYMKRSMNNVMINLQAYSKFENTYRPFPINLTVDGCAYFRGKMQTFYLGFIMKWLKKTSNLNHSCPYSGHVFIRNLTIGRVPVVAPNGEYRIDLHYFESSLKSSFGIQRIFITSG